MIDIIEMKNKTYVQYLLIKKLIIMRTLIKKVRFLTVHLPVSVIK